MEMVPFLGFCWSKRDDPIGVAPHGEDDRGRQAEYQSGCSEPRLAGIIRMGGAGDVVSLQDERRIKEVQAMLLKVAVTLGLVPVLDWHVPSRW